MGRLLRIRGVGRLTDSRPRLVSRLVYAVGRLRDAARARPTDENEPRSTERLGQPSRARPEGYLLWVHAETPDEAGAAPAVAQELSRTRGETFNVLITSSEMGPMIPAVARHSIHQLVPGETSGSVNRFLEYWRPDAGIILGIPDRPNLVHAARKKGVPLYLAASVRGSLAARRRLSYLSSSLLEQFNTCLAASAADAEVLHRHLDDGVKVEVTGPLTDTAFALSCSNRDRDRTALALAGRPVWLAADITLAELEAVEAAHRRAFRFAHRLLLVITPAKREDGAELARQLLEKGWDVALGSVDDEPSPGVQIFIADGEDAHGLWYRLAPITFVGGTLDLEAIPSDPYAPATLGSAVVHGPHLGAVAPRFLRLKAVEASLEIDSAEALGAAVQTLLAPDKAAVMAEAGWRVTTESAAAVERLADLINLSLDAREGA